MWKDFFFFSANDRRAIIVLSTILLAGITYLCLRPQEKIRPATTVETDSVTTPMLALQDSFLSHRPKIYLQPFEPNKADSLTLATLGLHPRIIRNILHYRAAGGVFRTTEALSRIYGMTNEEFARLHPYIFISPEFRYVSQKQTENKKKDKLPANTPATIHHNIKYPAGTIIDLNQADSNQLKRIPGIGSVLSHRIIAYRERLGGFVSLSQLHEIYNLPEGIGQWFYLSDTLPRKINLNADSIPHHPYLTYRQIRIIIRHHQQRGKLKNLQQLSTYPEFSPADLERLKPYITFQ